MTIVEFLHPLKGGAIRDVCLAALYFSERYNGSPEVTVEELRALLKRARVPRATKLNLADVLAKSAPYVDTAGKRSRSFLWKLTTAGKEHVRSTLGLPEAEPEIEHDVSSLESLLSSISDQEVADYLAEAIKCLSIVDARPVRPDNPVAACHGGPQTTMRRPACDRTQRYRS